MTAKLLKKIELVHRADPSDDLSDEITYECSFCSKTCIIRRQLNMCERVSKDAFFCAFCLRNGANTKHGRDLLRISFRAIPGYYYYKLFREKPSKIYRSEIKDYIELHRQVGLRNPIFDYDPQTMIWIVDFSKVGRTKNKVRISEVLKTIQNILISWNVYSYIPSASYYKMYQKFEEAILVFNKDRSRPEGRDLLIPTMDGIVIAPSKDLIELTRGFSENSIRWT